jgi:hypothetical protein
VVVLLAAGPSSDRCVVADIVAVAVVEAALLTAGSSFGHSAETEDAVAVEVAAHAVAAIEVDLLTAESSSVHWLEAEVADGFVAMTEVAAEIEVAVDVAIETELGAGLEPQRVLVVWVVAPFQPSPPYHGT